MDCNDYKNKIISYIEDELTEIDRQKFENELEINSDLKKEYHEIKQVLQSLSDLPEITASSDFMVSLNKKIDAYNKEKKGWNLFNNSIFKNDYFPRISTVAVSLIFILTIAYLWDSNFDNSSSSMLSNSSSIDNNSISNEIADVDSLDENLVIDK